MIEGIVQASAGSHQVLEPTDPKLDGVTATGEYTALVCAWAGGWEVFVLDPSEGLLGRTETVTLGEVETAARGFLAARFRRAASDFRVAVVRS